MEHTISLIHTTSKKVSTYVVSNILLSGKNEVLTNIFTALNAHTLLMLQINIKVKRNTFEKKSLKIIP